MRGWVDEATATENGVQHGRRLMQVGIRQRLPFSRCNLSDLTAWESDSGSWLLEESTLHHARQSTIHALHQSHPDIWYQFPYSSQGSISGSLPHFGRSSTIREHQSLAVMDTFRSSRTMPRSDPLGLFPLQLLWEHDTCREASPKRSAD